MKNFSIKELCEYLQIPNEVVVKFDSLKDLDIIKIKELFYNDEDKFFGFLEEKLNEKYLEILFIYLNLGVDLYYEYQNKSISEKIYFDTIDDIRIWINNCVKETGIYGLKEYYWINEHLRMRIYKLGRLQFQKRDASEFMDLIRDNKLNHRVKKDYFYFVHIPEGEKLTRDLVLDSYNRAIEFFKDEMVFACESWMLSDRLEMIFDSNSNVLKFRNDYIILSQNKEENHIKRYLNKGSRLLEKVNQLEEQGILIGEGFGICLNYVD